MNSAFATSEEQYLLLRIDECQDELTSVQTTCPAHGPLARSVSTLLHCQKADRLEKIQDRADRVDAGRRRFRSTVTTAGVVATIIGLILKYV